MGAAAHKGGIRLRESEMGQRVAHCGAQPAGAGQPSAVREMGFDRGDRRWSIPVSDTQAYKQFGNSVVVPLVEAVAKAMRPHIVGEARPDRREQLMLELAAAG